MHIIRSLALATAFALVLPGQATAQIALNPGEWTSFYFWDGPGFPIDGDGFLVQAQNPLNAIRVRVADGYVAGDAFDIFDGTFTWNTPSVQGPGYVDEFITDDPTVAYGHSQLSWLEFILAPQEGPYTLTLSVREGAPDAPSGEGFIFFEEMDVQPAPEPASIVLVATGLLAVTAVARRRRAAATL